MTDRAKGLIVVLDADIRTDDLIALKDAIKCMKHVIAVDHSVADPDDYMNRQRIRHELGLELWKVLYPEKK